MAGFLPDPLKHRQHLGVEAMIALDRNAPTAQPGHLLRCLL